MLYSFLILIFLELVSYPSKQKRYIYVLLIVLYYYLITNPYMLSLLSLIITILTIKSYDLYYHSVKYFTLGSY